MDHTPLRQLMIDLIESHMSQEDICAAFREMTPKIIDLTTGLRLIVRGINAGMLEITLIENNNQPRTELFLKMHFGIY